MINDNLYELFGEDQAGLIIEYLGKAEEIATSDYHLEPVYNYHYNLNPNGSELLEIIKQSLLSILETYYISLDESVDYKVVFAFIDAVAYLVDNPEFIENAIDADPIVIFDLINIELGEPLVYNDVLTLDVEVAPDFVEHFYSIAKRDTGEPSVIDEMARRAKILVVYNNLTNMLNDSEVFQDLKKETVFIFTDADRYLSGISDDPKVRCIDVAVALFVTEGKDVDLSTVENTYKRYVNENVMEEYKCVLTTISNITTFIEEKINEVE